MNSVNGDSRADLGDAAGDGGATLDIVQVTRALDAHDEVRAVITVKRLLESDLVAAKRVDLELPAELVHSRAVVIVVAALGAEMSVGAAGATGVAIL